MTKLTVLIEALQQAHPNVTAEDVADILWLADHLGKPSFDLAKKVLARQQSSAADILPGQSDKPPSSPPDLEAKDRQTSTEKQTIHALNQKGDTNSGSGNATPLSVAGAVALPKKRLIERALRPLKRRVASRHQLEFDEAATVRWIADTQLWTPMLRPTAERWLDAVLIVEESASMLLWRQVVTEFGELLENTGVFRNVQRWYTDFATDEERPKLFASYANLHQGRHAHTAAELIDPAGQRLFFVISDCVADAWYNNRAEEFQAAEFLNTLGKTNRVILLQMLPPRLWIRTGMRNFSQIHIATKTADFDNGNFILHESSALQLDDQQIKALDRHSQRPTPVMTLEPELANLCLQMVSGAAQQWAPALLPLSPQDDVQPPSSEETSETPPTALEIVQRFQGAASPLAQRLAGYLSAAPLHLRVIDLVQHEMLGSSTLAERAEVLYGGLLQPAAEYKSGIDPDKVRYEFIDGVRDQLRKTVGRSKLVEVIERIWKYIVSNTGQSLEFRALLHNPRLAGKIKLDANSLPFAQIASETLRALGGYYGELAGALQTVVDHAAEEAKRHNKADSTSSVDGQNAVRQLPAIVPPRPLGRETELKQVLAIIDEAYVNRPRGRKRLISIRGDAGIGKTWFLHALRERLLERHPTWNISPIYDANDFMTGRPYTNLAKLMGWCVSRPLVELPGDRDLTQQDIISRSNLLDQELKTKNGEPLIVLFDDTDRWINYLPEQKEFVDTILKHLWRVLMVHSGVPCIICHAGRQAITMNDFLLTRVQEPLTLSGFSHQELLNELVSKENQPRLAKWVEVMADGNPLLVKLLDEEVSADPFILTDKAAWDNARRRIVDKIIAPRLDEQSAEILYRLASVRRDGFHPEDPLLQEVSLLQSGPPHQPDTSPIINRLIRASLVEFRNDTKRYHVRSPLTGLFREVHS